MILAGLSVAVLLLLVSFALLFLRLASRFDAEPHSPSWLDEFSVDNYAPMERLLDRGDFVFLAAQPGYRPELAKRLLAARRKAFCEYLYQLIRDFNRLHFMAKLLLIHSPEDRPGFAAALWRQQLTFYFAVCLVRCKVALYPLGWTPVDVPELLEALETLRRQVRTVLPRQPLGPAPALPG
jgi:hypothetical protein